MPALRTANEICERALRKIGAFSTNDSAADPVELDEALHLLDLHMRYLAGTEFCTWLIQTNITINLTGGEASFNFPDRISSTVHDDGFMFPVHLELEINGNRTPVELVTRDKFDEIDDPTTTGRPCIAHLDRTNTPTMRLHPYPPTGEDTYDLILTYLSFNPDIRPTKAGQRRGGDVAHGLRAAWELWAVTITAAACADGPVRRLPQSEVRVMYAMAQDYLDRLVTFENREAVSGPPVTEGWRIV